MPFSSDHTGKDRKAATRTALIAMAVVLLFAGGFVYVAFRSPSLRLFGWMDALGLTGIVNHLRAACEDVALGHFTLYNLPDLLWMLSYLLFVNALIPKTDRRAYLFWVLLMPVLAIGHEVMQACGLMAGSFDVVDLACYIIPTAINLTTINISNNNVKLTQNNYEKEIQLGVVDDGCGGSIICGARSRLRDQRRPQ